MMGSNQLRPWGVYERSRLLGGSVVPRPSRRRLDLPGEKGPSLESR